MTHLKAQVNEAAFHTQQACSGLSESPMFFQVIVLETSRMLGKYFLNFSKFKFFQKILEIIYHLEINFYTEML